MRKIVVVTGTRAEYGILKPLLKKIESSSGLKLELIVTGIHLLNRYGLTVREIEKDGFGIIKKVKMYDEKVKTGYHGIALGEGVKNFTKLFLGSRIDILVVLGDRMEPLAASLAAALLKIPIAHIHGGDKTDSGHIDESVRYAITKFAHIHFAASLGSEERLLKIGEESWRIHNTGAPGLDSVLNYPKIKKETLFKKFDLDNSQGLILCIFHPVHLKVGETRGQIREVLSALKELKIQTLIIYPNNDAGAKDIIQEIEKCGDSSFLKVFPNLDHSDYINLFRQADVLIGNSSSGIIEAPSVKLPVVNIGSRNVGREHGENIIYADAQKKNIVVAVEKALYDKKFLARVKKGKNPYGNGKASTKIVKILSTIKINEKLLKKKITY